ncbi:hypothetical protein [Deinococcus sp.]|uniref:hypothetical protein n=1 Tax=Deinococcus sp. TaxID=47478 RepID=UPI003C7B5AF0
MKTLVLPLLALLAFLTLAPAQAVQLVVWDTQLQTKLGYGETVNGRLNLQLVTDYSGPVIALFSRDDSEKNSYPGLLPRYGGLLRGGVLTLDDDGAPLTLTKFLSAFKLTPSLQNPVKTFSLPGLKTPAPVPSPKVTVPGLPPTK